MNQPQIPDTSHMCGIFNFFNPCRGGGEGLKKSENNILDGPPKMKQAELLSGVDRTFI